MKRLALTAVLCGITVTSAYADLLQYDDLNGLRSSRAEDQLEDAGFRQTDSSIQNGNWYKTYRHRHPTAEVVLTERWGKVTAVDAKDSTHQDPKDEHSEHWARDRNRNIAIGAAAVAALGVGLYAMNHKSQSANQDSGHDARVDVSTLNGARGAGGEQFLTNNGFSNTRHDGLTNWWYNQTSGQCVQVQTWNGRYTSVQEVDAAHCK
ncbi:hypothetical protein [Silvimonas iriomotensis]|uniref:Uncharacterized protein n=1 Tax=Silvimonas iriomotensis TaxID=449662 RepID=A0ABQ2P3T1_9NEIS|nr:hypothetical protein [Silvimonas iriomotensis]GGP17611.1 hypothetical protein GCM10010970_00600 [Silvimonas iriomotensis]